MSLLLSLSAAFLLSLYVSFKLFLTIKSPSAAAELTRDHQGHSVSLIVVIHDNLTVVSAWVVGAETGDLQGSIQRVGSVSWQHDATTESLIHLDYITFGTEREVSSFKVSTGSPLILEKKGQKTYFLNWPPIISDWILHENRALEQFWLRI